MRLLACLALLLLLAAGARAETDLSALASTRFDDVRQGVEALATSGDPRAGDILSALQAGELYADADGVIYIKHDEATVLAATGAPAEPGALKAIRVNNAVRRAVDAAVGSLRLFAPDGSERADAAEAVFHSRDPLVLPVLERAIAGEKDDGIRRIMEQARAAILLTVPDTPDDRKLAAVGVLRERGDAEALSVISGVAEPSPPVAAAMEAARSSIEANLFAWSLGQSVFYGLSLGSVLLLAAAGLAITFGVMGVINMAHGEMVMLGAYTTFVVQETIRGYAPGLFGASLFISIPLAFLVSGLVGVAIERLLLRFLYGRPLETLLATWGVSLVLQQAVRSIFGADNRNVGTPAWMSGAQQIGGLVITTNRLTIIVFSVLVLGALMAVLRYTSIGLRMRAVTQNRRMASAMGIRTPWVDAMTFGLGSGIAGIAGVALSQIDNVSPNLGQGYIIDSFMVVVFGGVGNLWGTVLAALVLGVVNKFLEPVAGAVLGKIVVLLLLIAFIQKRPRGMFPLKGRAGGGVRAPILTVGLVLGGAILLAALNLATDPASAAHVPTYTVSLVGKYLCYAILALAVDLVWGYVGILTLGHAAFFALGGYAMGMYLMRQIGARGVYANPELPDFMVFLNYKELPWYWHGFEWFAFAVFMAMFVPGVLAAGFGWLAFRSRVTGVYLSIITQALTYALLLAFFRNDMGFGGNNGLTDFKEIIGFPLTADATRSGLLVVTAVVLCLLYLLARAVTRSRFGKVLIAVRDTESRTRFLGYRPERYKLVVFALSAVMAGIGGALYVPQVGIINPGEFAPANSIEAVIWVAVGGRGTLSGAILGAVLVNFGKTVLTGELPELWLFALGALFIVVTLFLPRGILGLWPVRDPGAPPLPAAPLPPIAAAEKEATG